MPPDANSPPEPEAPLFGVILAGGKSNRMRRDKATIEYHGHSQIRHCAELLKPHCREVFVSLREPSDTGDLPALFDHFGDIGPMGGILTALDEYPKAAWLVLACDLPFVDTETLAQLIQARDPDSIATCFESEGRAEPCCTIYEPRANGPLSAAIGKDIPDRGSGVPPLCANQKTQANYSLQPILKGPAVNRITPAYPTRLLNVNTPAERAAAQQRIDFEKANS